MYGFLVSVLILDSLVLTTAILLQAGQGGGLASLGGGAGTEQFMGGRQATTLLTKITWWCAGIFLSVSLDRKSTRLNSSHGYISYAVFCLKKKNVRHVWRHAYQRVL